MCYLSHMQDTTLTSATATLTLAERQEIATAYLAKIKQDAQNQSFPEHFELAYLRATLDGIICRFPEVAKQIGR